jgi:uncharacterized membrane protein YcgQ (UPF0703/DUF1980 family)
MKAFVKSFGILFLIITLSACYTTSVKKLYKKSEKYQGKNIRVRGRVVSSIELSDLRSFTIRNRKGKIMVVTENLLPLKNDRLRVKGKFERNFIYKDQNMMVIKEKKMKSRKIPDSKKKINKL